jgi:hypothetical protein
MSVFGSDRERRAANNQSLFRAGNERLKQFNEDWFGTVLPRGGWVCECANDSCLEHIEMTSSEYEAVRQDGARFFVAPSEEHVWLDVERVIECNDRYWIVEKTGNAHDIAKRADPRAKAEPPLSLHT